MQGRQALRQLRNNPSIRILSFHTFHSYVRCVSWRTPAPPNDETSIDLVVQADTATVGGYAGLAGLRRKGRKAGEGVGNIYRCAHRRGRPIPAELDSWHLVAWRFDCRQ